MSGSCACRDKLDPLTAQTPSKQTNKQAAEGKWERTNLACANIAWFWQTLCSVGTGYNFCMLSPGTTTQSVQVMLKYKPQSRQLKWRTSVGFDVDCTAWISRQRQRSSTTWNPCNKELRERLPSLFPLGYEVFKYSSHAGTLSHNQQRGCA